MKTVRSFFRDARRHRGLALIIVLSMLALATIVMLAFLSVADTEHKGTLGYSSSQTARRLSDTAVNLVIAQIRAGSDQDSYPGREFHATQPGAVRKYTQDGAFLAGYKLFSDSAMIFKGSGNSDKNTAALEEYEFVKNSEPPADGWNQGNNTLRYVDMNDPVVKGVAAADGTVNASQVYFPIIDPRAAFDMDAGPGNLPVEGFQYSTTSALSGARLDMADEAKVVPLVQPPAGIDTLRLAMPVQWLYMLKDGTLGTLDADLNFTGSGGSIASAENPIIARLAFWADDETCKINVNTAGEPTFQGRPTYFHERDHQWADFPAARGEYQRFPGHPATVALSSVLYPNPLLVTGPQSDRDMDPYRKTPGGAPLRKVLSVKDRIYAVVPRLAGGGSEAGTKLFAADTYNKGGAGGLTKDVVLDAALQEHLYASMDELIFSSQAGGGTGGRGRTVATLDGGGNLFDKQTLERASGFLSAHSRGSEISMLGLPRIAMWPISSNTANRTGFDNLIAFCSRLGPQGSGNQYIFQRNDSRDPSSDISNIKRNKDLLEMLDKILATAVFPADTQNSGKGNTFKAKMGDGSGQGGKFENYRQVIVEMFDYIRSTNLYDSFLAEPQRNNWPMYATNGASSAQTYKIRDDLLPSIRTFTPPIARNPGSGTNGRGNVSRDDPYDDRMLPGHGQVTPIVWNVGQTNYRGFGRAISISEIGLHFICTADGQPDMYSWRNPVLKDDPMTPAKEYEIPPINMVNVPGVDADVVPPSQFDAKQLEDGVNVIGNISGGRTALKIENVNEKYLIEHGVPKGFAFGDFEFVNSGWQPVAGSQYWADKGRSAKNWLKRRYYSNYPPKPEKGVGLYGSVVGEENDANRGFHENNHPGFQEENWNYTLPPGQPLETNEKMVQAMLHLEFFCPSVGYTAIFPEFTVVIDGTSLGQIEASTTNGGSQLLFPTGGEDIVLKSSTPIYEVDGTPQVGGYCSFRRLARARGLPGRGLLSGDPSPTYDGSATGNGHTGMLNLDLISNFYKVTSDQPMTFRSPTGGNGIQIRIYNSHDYKGGNTQPIQTIYFKIPPGQSPTPDLVTQPTHLEQWFDASGILSRHPTVQAPHWWCFHRSGCIARGSDQALRGRLAETADIDSTKGTGRANRDGDTAATGQANRHPDSVQRYPGTTALIYGFDNTGNYMHAVRHDNQGNSDARIKEIRQSRITYRTDPDGGLYNRMGLHVGSDVVRSIQPGHGDARLLFAKTVVLADDWTVHPLWKSDFAFLAHNFSSYNAGSEPGFDRSGDDGLQVQRKDDSFKRALPESVYAETAYTPDAPFAGDNSKTLNATTQQLSPAYLARRYFDFDDPDPGGRIGTFINKPDEGNFAVGEYKGSNWPSAVTWRASYFRASSFGSAFANSGRSFFTPNRMISSPVMMGSLPSRVFFDNVKGEDAGDDGNGAWTNLLFRPHIPMGGMLRHPGQATPPDHYLLDLFWMPVVEPYAISEPLSTAGKVNMNYQMLPFTHIRRATALHAVMKGELFAALPNVDYSRARKVRSDFQNLGATQPFFQDESVGQGGQRAAKWHRSIVIDRLNKENGGADTAWWINKTATQRVVGTLRQFEERFNFGAQETPNGPSGVGGSAANEGLPVNFRSGLFRTASQICETHLIPSRVSTAGNAVDFNVPNQARSVIVKGAHLESNENVRAGDLDGYKKREDAMLTFWSNHLATGDNTREAPYSNLYAKLTTRSNTFRVHVRAQTVKKALRGTKINSFVPGEDEVTGEYRGSFLLERYIDTKDLTEAGAKANFADPDSGHPLDELKHPPLDSYYRFRIIETKRFAP